MKITNKKYNLQYISQGATPVEHLQNIGKVCEAGCRWVQLRLKEVSLVTYLETAQKAREICDQYGAIFIVNDNVGIAAESKADGVHLGLNDSSIEEARKTLGENAIIGGTANTIENCLQHVKDGADYIGLGPFRFTETKKKLSPILGTAGYKKILEELKNKKIETPIIAIGGITVADIPELLQTGISGIAVSGMLTQIPEDDLEEQIAGIQTTFRSHTRDLKPETQNH